MRAVVYRYVPKLVRIPPLRKVVAQDGAFLCGMCMTSYEQIEDAYACLHHCWHDFLEEMPVVKRRARGGMVYRCRLCGKHYGTEDEGLVCANECLMRSNAIFAEELKIEKMAAQPLSGRRPGRINMAAFLRDTKFVSRWNWRRGVVSDAAETESAPAPVPAPVKVAAANAPVKAAKAAAAAPEAVSKPVAAVAEEAPAVVRRKKSAYKQGWHRANAKYQCDLCHSGYFTRAEVNKCFDGHFDAEGLEIV